jgi:hypothetical protein
VICGNILADYSAGFMERTSECNIARSIHSCTVRLRRGMTETNNSTSDALRVITEMLEELTSSLTSHEKALNEREKVHAAELSS